MIEPSPEDDTEWGHCDCLADGPHERDCASLYPMSEEEPRTLQIPAIEAHAFERALKNWGIEHDRRQPTRFMPGADGNHHPHSIPFTVDRWFERLHVTIELVCEREGQHGSDVRIADALDAIFVRTSADELEALWRLGGARALEGPVHEALADLLYDALQTRVRRPT